MLLDQKAFEEAYSRYRECTNSPVHKSQVQQVIEAWLYALAALKPQEPVAEVYVACCNDQALEDLRAGLSAEMHPITWQGDEWPNLLCSAMKAQETLPEPPSLPTTAGGGE